MYERKSNGLGKFWKFSAFLDVKIGIISACRTWKDKDVKARIMVNLFVRCATNSSSKRYCEGSLKNVRMNNGRGDQPKGREVFDWFRTRLVPIWVMGLWKVSLAMGCTNIDLQTLHDTWCSVSIGSGRWCSRFVVDADFYCRPSMIECITRSSMSISLIELTCVKSAV